MNEVQSSLLQVKEVFKSHPQLYIWVIHYGIAHHYMELAVHKGDYPRCVKIACEDCFYFSGFLQGGPYIPDVSVHQDSKTGESIVIISGNTNELVIRCSKIRILEVRV